MECNEARQLLPLSIDDELDGRGELALAEHLAACADCREQQRQMATLSRFVRAKASRHRAPEDLRRRLQARTGDNTRSSSAISAPGAAGWRLRLATGTVLGAGGWVLAAVLAGVLLTQPANRRAEPDDLTTQLVADHARAIVTGHLVDVASSDKHTVKPWLSSRLDFSPPVRDFAEQGFPLVGGRIDYLDRRVVAVLVYRRRQHLIDVFVEPATAARSVSVRGDVYGFQVVSWQHDGMIFRAVSDVEAGELAKLSELEGH